VPRRTDEEITVTRETLFIRRLPRIRQGVRRNLYVAGHHGPTATNGTVMKRLIVGLSTTVLVWGGVAGVVHAGIAASTSAAWPQFLPNPALVPVI
jgi:hypothetical protein